MPPSSSELWVGISEHVGRTVASLFALLKYGATVWSARRLGLE
jgi:hypothetical protein